MVDNGEADDKIVAVLIGDLFWGEAKEIADLPPRLVQRLVHYFSTYKLAPGVPSRIAIGEPYGPEHAREVIRASIADYDEEFGGD
jgi:inorganic pyrophosphatase